MKKDKITLLQKFKDISNVDVLKTSSFFDLYPWYYIDPTINLQDDILIKMDKFNKSQFDTYLKYLRHEIAEHYIYNPNESLIPKTIERYNIVESDFPPFYIKEFENFARIIHPSNKEGFADYLIQREIHLYAAHKEAAKILSFIDGMLNDSQIESSDSKEQPINKYPRIFTDEKAYLLFEKLVEEFKVKKYALANFSYIFHRMKKDGLIYEDYMQTEFVFFLLNFDVNIDRIKRLGEIGNKENKEETYNRLKKI